jgi:HAD superfamily hydrolase (TIGR01490 family)
MNDKKQVIAAFDFDGTISYHDSQLPYLIFCAGRGQSIINLLQEIPSLIGFGLGTVSRQEIKERIFTRFFKGQPIERLNELGEKFAAEYIPNHVKPEAMKRIQWHKDQGHRLVLISAAIDNFLKPWALKAGFTDVITSRLAEDSNRLATGKLRGANCWGTEKTRLLTELLGNKREDYIIFAYGDSKGDIPLLEYADYPFYRVMPGEK